MTADVIDLGIRCCLLGWVIVRDSEIPVVRPCEEHRPAQYARWAAGDYRPTPWEWFEGVAS
ncbi:MAG: hypothetical protein KY447_09365 [Actinobacteria bacterium]|nr:hypothetical protein [Actinomycetota bacterium]